MLDIFRKEIRFANELPIQSERLTYLTSVLRSLLQVNAISSLEVLKKLTPHDSSELDSFLERFKNPSDGLPIEVMDMATPRIRSYVCKNHLPGWFEREENSKKSLIEELTSWVAFRNKKPGHGVLSQTDIAEWTPKTEAICERALQVFKNFLPIVSSGETLTLAPEYSNLNISTPLTHQESAIVVTKITSRKNLWKLLGQTLCWDKSCEITKDLTENCVFSRGSYENTNKFVYLQIETAEKKHSLFHNIPIRQTNTFEGRKKELAKLSEWLIGDEEPTTCLVHGDGGYGKTTLTLEFLNSFLDGDIPLDGKLPEIISYHTAKMTKWTDQGLTHFRGISNAMEDCIRELMYCLEDVLTKDWYTLEGDALISKVKNELSRHGYQRDDVILVLDNTETLASSPSEVEELSEFFEKAAKKIGRIIITSRRREYMASKAIQISSLSEEESVRLIQRLALEYNATAIIKAGDARLKRVCNQLSRKPLLIDALVRHIARANTGIDDALSNIFSKSNDELLEFLYEDAWVRMSEAQRCIYMILVSIGCPADSFSIGSACQQVQIPHGEFQLSLDETYFANLTDYGRHYELEMVDLAKNFFLQKLSKLPNLEKEKIAEWSRVVDEKALKKEEVEREYKEDRIAEAFRNQYAKAAKLATNKGQLADARDYFEMAIKEDPLNAALHDRFAWFALNKLHNPNLALSLSEKSVELNPRSGDTLITLALTHYHLDNIEKGDIAINQAHKEGKPLYLCFLRMGIARYHSSKKLEDKSKVLSLLESGLDLLTRAKKDITPSSKYYSKNTSELNKYIALTQNAVHVIKSTQTIIPNGLLNGAPIGSRPLG